MAKKKMTTKRDNKKGFHQDHDPGHSLEVGKLYLLHAGESNGGVAQWIDFYEGEKYGTYFTIRDQPRQEIFVLSGLTLLLVKIEDRGDLAAGEKGEVQRYREGVTLHFLGASGPSRPKDRTVLNLCIVFNKPSYELIDEWFRPGTTKKNKKKKSRHDE